MSNYITFTLYFPTSLISAQRRRHPSEMSNPEMALVLEKEHLRSAEESDYMVMENLIQRRYEDEESHSSGLLSVVSEAREYRVSPARTLRRASAIEGDILQTSGKNKEI